jgi:NADP-dependent 3-hydroxy acid dehydrogenase YdfG
VLHLLYDLYSMHAMADRQLQVLVTGASSGIGRAAAIELAGRGHRVFASARRLTELEALAEARAGITAVQFDVTDDAGVQAAVAQIDELTSEHGVDVLVNSAGYALGGPVEALSSEAVEHQFQTNVFGLLRVTRAFLPRMRARRAGRVINVSSVVGRVVFPGMGVYSATKFAVEALSDALRMELAGFGVFVSLIEPGFVTTDIGPASAQQSAEFPVSIDGYEDLASKAGAWVAKQIAENAIPAEQVGRRIAEAATARRPKPRYLLPASSRILLGTIGSLPAGAADRVKRRVIGL